MAVGDIQNMLSRLNANGKTLYITQEVVYGAGQPVTPNEYTQTGTFARVTWLRLKCRADVPFPGDVQEYVFVLDPTSAISYPFAVDPDSASRMPSRAR